LLLIYGPQQFNKLYQTGRRHYPGSSDYQGVYGKDLKTLEREWRAWLANEKT